MAISIALIGDFNPEVIAHQAIPKALNLAAQMLNIELEFKWIATDAVKNTQLSVFNGIWCVPASPYKSAQGALQAIEFARVNKIAFLGTCGGYQHAALEFARNQLGFADADSAEENPACKMPLIEGLMCKLVEKTDGIILQENSKIAQIYKSTQVQEDYHCSFGINPQYQSIFDNSDLAITGRDNTGDPRTIELANHPFFIGTAYQPERSAFKNVTHPVIVEFLRVANRAANN